MEEINVPLLTIIGFFGSAFAWLALRQHQSDTRIAVGDSKLENLSKQLEDVKDDMEKRIDRFETHVNTKFDKVFEKIEQITRR